MTLWFRVIMWFIMNEECVYTVTSVVTGVVSIRSRPCSPLDVFRFGWVLYIYVKSE